MPIFDQSINKLENGIRSSVWRQQKIAKNIANLNNPKYVPDSFGKELNAAQVKRKKKLLLEEEMSNMSKNSIKYNAYLRILGMKYKSLKRISTMGK